MGSEQHSNGIQMKNEIITYYDDKTQTTELAMKKLSPYIVLEYFLIAHARSTYKWYVYLSGDNKIRTI